MYLQFLYSSILIEYIVLHALIIGKTAVGIWRRTDPEEYMLYIGIALAKDKFDFCIIDSELNRIRTEIIINNDTVLFAIFFKSHSSGTFSLIILIM